MHDWSRVPGWLWHQMQLGWVVHLCDACNRLLPASECYALMEDASAPLDSSLSFDLPDTAFDGLDEEAFAEAKRRTVAIRRVKGHGKVALIEVTCPAIKHVESAYRVFVAKVRTACEMGLSVLVIDPFPPTKRDPNGIHAAIWDAMTGKPFAIPADKPLTLVSYFTGENDITAYVDPIAVGDVLPDKPLFLGGGRHVNVPLEATYGAAWQTFPAEWRNVLTGTGK